MAQLDLFLPEEPATRPAVARLVERRRHARLSRLPPGPVGGSPARGLISRPSELIDRFRSHPGSGAVPEAIVSIFRAAEQGFPQRQADLFEDLLENDGHLRSLVESRVASVAGKSWQVQAGGDTPADRRAAEQLDAALRRTNFHDLIVHQLHAAFYGWSLSEIRWDLSPAGVLVPSWFVNVPWRRVAFDRSDRPRLLTDQSRTEGLELDAGLWVYSTHSSSGIVARAGLFRTTAWWALFKRMAVRDWVIFCEKFGIPLVYGAHDEDAPDEVIQALESAVEDIGEAGQAVFTKGQEIKIEYGATKGNNETVFGALTALCNSEMSKAVAGATQHIEAGNVGSYAQAQTHADRGWDLTIADAEALALTFERDIAARFVEVNGMQAAPPRLKIALVRDMQPLTRAQVASTLANELGLELDEEQIRQEFQFRAPTGSALKGTKAGPAAPSDPDPP